MDIFSKDEKDTLLHVLGKDQIIIIEAAIERAMNKSVEQALLMMPKALVSLLKHMSDVKAISADFFGKPENKDLANHEARFKEIITEVESAKPGLSPQEVLESAGDILRKELAMQSALKPANPGSIGGNIDVKL